MKRFSWFCFLAVAAILTSASLAYAEDTAIKKPNDPNISFGLGGSAGIFNAAASTGSNRYKPDFGYGWGLIVETMFTNTIGLHTGLWYQQINILMEMKSTTTGNTNELTSTANTLSVPLTLIASFNKGIFSFNFLPGIVFMYLIDDTIKSKDPTPSGSSTADVTRYMGHAQFGFCVGMNFKFRVARYFDIFVGFMTDFYVTDLITEDNHDNSNRYDHLYGTKLLMGFLFRTNLYPMEN